jgi:hypothetical protein
VEVKVDEYLWRLNLHRKGLKYDREEENEEEVNLQIQSRLIK